VKGSCVVAALAAIVLLGVPAELRAASSRTVSFRADDGVAVAATWYEATRRPAPAVILLHMLSRSRADWRVVADRLVDAGMHALAIDFRGHGDSGSGQLADAAQLSRFVLDVRAARAFLLSLEGLVDASAIGVAGASVGANVGLLEAADDGTVRSLVLLSPSLNYQSLRSEAAMRQYAGRPALLVAGADDPYALRSMKALAAVGDGIREMRTVEQGGHGTIMLARQPDLAGAVVDWFLRTLL
jgi:alpha-beta hydrolase superfamily lysophospholipase